MTTSTRLSILLLALLTLIYCPALSLGAEYRSSKGYRLTYPDTWKILTKEQQQTVQDRASQMLKNIDLSSVDVMVYHPNTAPLQNINVVVTMGGMVANETSVQEVQSNLGNRLSASGITVENLESHLTRVGKYDAVFASWVAGGPVFGGQKMSQQQYYISDGSHTYIVTCTAGEGSAAEVKPTFDSILNSFQMDGSQGGMNGLPKAVQGGIIGAIVGGFIGLFAKKTRRK